MSRSVRAWTTSAPASRATRLPRPSAPTTPRAVMCSPSRPGGVAIEVAREGVVEVLPVEHHKPPPSVAFCQGHPGDEVGPNPRAICLRRGAPGATSCMASPRSSRWAARLAPAGRPPTMMRSKSGVVVGIWGEPIPRWFWVCYAGFWLVLCGCVGFEFATRARFASCSTSTAFDGCSSCPRFFGRLRPCDPLMRRVVVNDRWVLLHLCGAGRHGLARTCSASGRKGTWLPWNPSPLRS